MNGIMRDAAEGRVLAMTALRRCPAEVLKAKLPAFAHIICRRSLAVTVC